LCIFSKRSAANNSLKCKRHTGFGLTQTGYCNKINTKEYIKFKDKGENDMLSKTLTVINPSGLHLRPAGVLSQTAMKFKSDIIVEYGEKRIVAKSVLNVMAAGIKSGAEINLICDGEDEEAAMKTMSEAIESGLGEM
jgi:phosphocarrier protein